MTDETPPDWFSQLDADAQAALLADPHGDLPAGLVDKILRHVNQTYFTETDSPRRWQLWPDDARRIEAERRRRDNETT